MGASMMSSGAYANAIQRSDAAIILNENGELRIERASATAKALEFSPFSSGSDVVVSGFSDPLGMGVDPALKLFSGEVQHMDLLGDYRPSNPHNPEEIAPTPESIQSSQLINSLLHGFVLPNHKELVKAQLSVNDAEASRFSNKPRTREGSPLNLAGYGSVSEFSKPVQLHWSHCPDYASRRMLFKRLPEKGRTKRCTKPPCDCFAI